MPHVIKRRWHCKAWGYSTTMPPPATITVFNFHNAQCMSSYFTVANYVPVLSP